MIRTFDRWMRRVLPPYSTCLLALSPIVGAFLLECLIVQRIYSEWVNPLAIEEGLPFHMHQGILAGIACAYGVWRVAGFHPFFRVKYREWLKTAAWDPSQPLPFGSPTFAWQDGVVLLAMGALAGSWDWALATGAAMLGGWSVMLIAANFAAQLDWLALLGSIAMLPVTLSDHFPWLGGATLLAYLISAQGVKPSLQLFPWERMPRWDALRSTKVEQCGRPSDSWPLLRTPHVGAVEVASSTGVALKLATFAGMATLTLTAAADLDQHRRGWGEFDASPLLATATLLLTAGRLFTYCGTCRPPISLVGRIVTQRLIVPGFEQALVAPLLTLLVGFGAPIILWNWGFGNAISTGITMFLLFALALGLGPNLAQWQMTGAHRIVVQKPTGSNRLTRPLEGR